MTLKELKISLTRLPSDFDDYAVVIVVKSEDSAEVTHQLLAATGVMKVGDDLIPGLFSAEALRHRAKDGGVAMQDGTPLDL